MGVGPLNFLVHLSKSMSGPGRYAGPWILGRPSKTHRKHPCRVAGRLGKGARLSSLVAAKRLGQLAGDVVEGGLGGRPNSLTPTVKTLTEGVNSGVGHAARNSVDCHHTHATNTLHVMNTLVL